MSPFAKSLAIDAFKGRSPQCSLTLRTHLRIVSNVIPPAIIVPSASAVRVVFEVPTAGLATTPIPTPVVISGLILVIDAATNTPFFVFSDVHLPGGDRERILETNSASMRSLPERTFFRNEGTPRLV